MLDENLSGPKVAGPTRQLRDWQVVTHTDAFPRDKHPDPVPDPVVLERCGKENWILISCDDRIRRVPRNKAAAIEHRAKVFMFPEGNYSGPEYVAALTIARRKLLNLARKTAGPFFARIHINGDVSLLDQKPKQEMTSRERTALKYGHTQKESAIDVEA
jgi:hypothetical protein